MHAELLVPGLLAAGAGGRFAALELLLARGRRRAGAAQRAEEWLRDAFELGERFPAGALTLLASGGEPGAQPWVRADPVHLRLMRDRLIVVPAGTFDLSAEEAGALCEALNAHFPAMSFTACEPRRWCAVAPEGLGTDAGNPLDIAGREIEVPREAAALLTEAQMVLHGHPVNEAREARGEPAVNSLWFWGAGSAARARARWHSVAADEAAVLGAARLAGVRHRALPPTAREWLERLPEDGHHLAVLDSLREGNTLEKTEQDWFAPLLAALRAGRIGMITIHVPDAAEALSFETVRADLRRFWRTAKPLERYA
jgi:hypothetical protein